MRRARLTTPPPAPSWPARPDVAKSTPIYVDHAYRGEVVSLRSGGFEAVAKHGRFIGRFTTEAAARAAVIATMQAEEQGDGG
jgi:hypothetical protein